ncbi:hypothetical protein BBJ28_00006676, partial [Nothophytophthora sp. Chile5]
MTTGGRRLPKLRATGRGIGQSPLSTSSKSSSSDNSAIMQLLEQVASGEVSPQAAAEFFGPKLEYESVGGFAKIDTSRGARTGFPEVVYAESKTPQQVAAIMKVMIDGGESNVMASRVDAKMADEIRALLLDHHLTYYEVPRILASKVLGIVQGSGGVAGPAASDGKKVNDHLMRCCCARLTWSALLVGVYSPHFILQKAPVACVLCAGTSDLPVAEEAAVTLELADYRVTRLYDVGVAGIHRLLRNQHVLQASDVAICVAGMDGALPGVVVRAIPSIDSEFILNLIGSLTFGLPTSVGYGAAFGGLAPLLTMLNACSPGVGVVNIDNGFGAAVLA